LYNIAKEKRGKREVMTKLTNGLFFIADGWGATKGGINAFNYDLCIALGKIAER